MFGYTYYCIHMQVFPIFEKFAYQEIQRVLVLQVSRYFPLLKRKKNNIIYNPSQKKDENYLRALNKICLLSD